MMRFALAIAAAALVISPSTSAAQLTVSANANAPVIASIGSRAVFATFNGDPGSTHVGPFSMTFGGIFGSAIQDIVCVDLHNFFFDGQAYTARLTLLSSGDADLISRTRRGLTLGDAASTRQSYLQMAWLADQFASQPTTSWAGIQGAIWHAGTGATPFGGTTNPDVQFWLDQLSSADLSTVNASAWVVVTDDAVTGPNGGAQEFLVRSNVVPEPSTYALMLTGFAGLVMVSRRRRAVR
jgi:hypothetical protein